VLKEKRKGERGEKGLLLRSSEEEEGKKGKIIRPTCSEAGEMRRGKKTSPEKKKGEKTGYPAAELRVKENVFWGKGENRICLLIF